MSVSQGVFSDRGTIKFPLWAKRNLEDGIVLRPALPHTTLTVSSIYAIHPGVTGNVTAALADDASVYRVGVALEAAVASSTRVSWLQTGGYYATLTTPSLSTAAADTLGIGGGAIVDEASAVPIAAKTFAINVDATSSGTSHAVILLDREITAST